jgi:hypothetical protein
MEKWSLARRNLNVVCKQNSDRVGDLCFVHGLHGRQTIVHPPHASCMRRMHTVHALHARCMLRAHLEMRTHFEVLHACAAA